MSEQSPPTNEILMRAKLAFLMGPLPIMGLAFAVQRGILDAYQMELYAATVFAYWGLFVGLLQRSLLRSIVGLNLGAGIGYSWGYYMSHATFNNTFLQTNCAVASFACAGAALSWIAVQDTENPLKSMVKGMLGGGFAFGLAAMLALMLSGVFGSSIMGMILAIILPFWIGHFAFLTFSIAKPKSVAV